jgi:N-acetylglucosamine-6-phosphate deacetylase
MSHSGTVVGWDYASREAVRLRWEAGLIRSVERAETAPVDLWLAPPLVDLQVNGFGGVDFQQDDLTAQDLLSAARSLRSAGCGRFLVTLITDKWDKLMTRLSHLRSLRNASAELSRAIAGWHLEGPFLSGEPGFVGTHNARLVCDPEERHITELRQVAGDDLVLLTLAPERRGALEALRLAVSLGMKVSLGHTNASAEVLRVAVAGGAFGFTHLANGCPADLNRHDNILWRVLDEPRLVASLIPDGIHVSPPLFRLLHRALGSGRIYYISDAMAAGGAPPGRYRLGDIEVEVDADQVVRQPGSPYLSGSALRPVDAVFRAAQMLGCPWQEAWHRMSENPARLMGLDYGLAPGLRAEFCVLKVNSTGELFDLETRCY